MTDQDRLKEAITAVLKGSSLSAAARQYNINKGLLSAAISGYKLALRPEPPEPVIPRLTEVKRPFHEFLEGEGLVALVFFLIGFDVGWLILIGTGEI